MFMEYTNWIFKHLIFFFLQMEAIIGLADDGLSAKTNTIDIYVTVIGQFDHSK